MFKHTINKSGSGIGLDIMSLGGKSPTIGGKAPGLQSHHGISKEELSFLGIDHDKFIKKGYKSLKEIYDAIIRESHINTKLGNFLKSPDSKTLIESFVYTIGDIYGKLGKFSELDKLGDKLSGKNGGLESSSVFPEVTDRVDVSEEMNRRKGERVAIDTFIKEGGLKKYFDMDGSKDIKDIDIQTALSYFRSHYNGKLSVDERKRILKIFVGYITYYVKKKYFKDRSKLVEESLLNDNEYLSDEDMKIIFGIDRTKQDISEMGHSMLTEAFENFKFYKKSMKSSDKDILDRKVDYFLNSGDQPKIKEALNKMLVKVTKDSDDANKKAKDEAAKKGEPLNFIDPNHELKRSIGILLKSNDYSSVPEEIESILNKDYNISTKVKVDDDGVKEKLKQLKASGDYGHMSDDMKEFFKKSGVFSGTKFDVMYKFFNEIRDSKNIEGRKLLSEMGRYLGGDPFLSAYSATGDKEIYKPSTPMVDDPSVVSTVFHRIRNMIKKFSFDDLVDPNKVKASIQDFVDKLGPHGVGGQEDPIGDLKKKIVEIQSDVNKLRLSDEEFEYMATRDSENYLSGEVTKSAAVAVDTGDSSQRKSKINDIEKAFSLYSIVYNKINKISKDLEQGMDPLEAKKNLIVALYDSSRGSLESFINEFCSDIKLSDSNNAEVSPIGILKGSVNIKAPKSAVYKLVSSKEPDISKMKKENKDKYKKDLSEDISLAVGYIKHTVLDPLRKIIDREYDTYGKSKVVDLTDPDNAFGFGKDIEGEFSNIEDSINKMGRGFYGYAKEGQYLLRDYYKTLKKLVDTNFKNIYLKSKEDEKSYSVYSELGNIYSMHHRSFNPKQDATLNEVKGTVKLLRNTIINPILNFLSKYHDEKYRVKRMSDEEIKNSLISKYKSDKDTFTNLISNIEIYRDIISKGKSEMQSELGAAGSDLSKLKDIYHPFTQLDILLSFILKQQEMTSMWDVHRKGPMKWSINEGMASNLDSYMKVLEDISSKVYTNDNKGKANRKSDLNKLNQVSNKLLNSISSRDVSEEVKTYQEEQEMARNIQTGVLRRTVPKEVTPTVPKEVTPTEAMPKGVVTKEASSNDKGQVADISKIDDKIESIKGYQESVNKFIDEARSLEQPLKEIYDHIGIMGKRVVDPTIEVPDLKELVEKIKSIKNKLVRVYTDMVKKILKSVYEWAGDLTKFISAPGDISVKKPSKASNKPSKAVKVEGPKKGIKGGKGGKKPVIKLPKKKEGSIDPMKADVVVRFLREAASKMSAVADKQLYPGLPGGGSVSPDSSRLPAEPRFLTKSRKGIPEGQIPYAKKITKMGDKFIDSFFERPGFEKKFIEALNFLNVGNFEGVSSSIVSDIDINAIVNKAIKSVGDFTGISDRIVKDESTGKIKEKSVIGGDKLDTLKKVLNKEITKEIDRAYKGSVHEKELPKDLGKKVAGSIDYDHINEWIKDRAKKIEDVDILNNNVHDFLVRLLSTGIPASINAISPTLFKGLGQKATEFLDNDPIIDEAIRMATNGTVSDLEQFFTISKADINLFNDSLKKNAEELEKYGVDEEWLDTNNLMPDSTGKSDLPRVEKELNEEESPSEKVLKKIVNSIDSFKNLFEDPMGYIKGRVKEDINDRKSDKSEVVRNFNLVEDKINNMSDDDRITDILTKEEIKNLVDIHRKYNKKGKGLSDEQYLVKFLNNTPSLDTLIRKSDMDTRGFKVTKVFEVYGKEDQDITGKSVLSGDLRHEYVIMTVFDVDKFNKEIKSLTNLLNKYHIKYKIDELKSNDSSSKYRITIERPTIKDKIDVFTEYLDKSIRSLGVIKEIPDKMLQAPDLETARAISEKELNKDEYVSYKKLWTKYIPYFDPNKDAEVNKWPIKYSPDVLNALNKLMKYFSDLSAESVKYEGLLPALDLDGWDRLKEKEDKLLDQYKVRDLVELWNSTFVDFYKLYSIFSTTKAPDLSDDSQSGLEYMNSRLVRYNVYIKKLGSLLERLKNDMDSDVLWGELISNLSSGATTVWYVPEKSGKYTKTGTELKKLIQNKKYKEVYDYLAGYLEKMKEDTRHYSNAINILEGKDISDLETTKDIEEKKETLTSTSDKIIESIKKIQEIMLQEYKNEVDKFESKNSTKRYREDLKKKRLSDYNSKIKVLNSKLKSMDQKDKSGISRIKSNIDFLKKNKEKEVKTLSEKVEPKRYTLLNKFINDNLKNISKEVQNPIAELTSPSHTIRKMAGIDDGSQKEFGVENWLVSHDLDDASLRKYKYMDTFEHYLDTIQKEIDETPKTPDNVKNIVELTKKLEDTKKLKNYNIKIKGLEDRGNIKFKDAPRIFKEILDEYFYGKDEEFKSGGRFYELAQKDIKKNRIVSLLNKRKSLLDTIRKYNEATSKYKEVPNRVNILTDKELKDMKELFWNKMYHSIDYMIGKPTSDSIIGLPESNSVYYENFFRTFQPYSRVKLNKKLSNLLDFYGRSMRGSGSKKLSTKMLRELTALAKAYRESNIDPKTRPLVNKMIEDIKAQRKHELEFYKILEYTKGLNSSDEMKRALALRSGFDYDENKKLVDKYLEHRLDKIFNPKEVKDKDINKLAENITPSDENEVETLVTFVEKIKEALKTDQDGLLLAEKALKEREAQLLDELKKNPQVNNKYKTNLEEEKQKSYLDDYPKLSKVYYNRDIIKRDIKEIPRRFSSLGLVNKLMTDIMGAREEQEVIENKYKKNKNSVSKTTMNNLKEVDSILTSMEDKIVDSVEANLYNIKKIRDPKNNVVELNRLRDGEMNKDKINKLADTFKSIYRNISSLPENIRNNDKVRGLIIELDGYRKIYQDALRKGLNDNKFFLKEILSGVDVPEVETKVMEEPTKKSVTVKDNLDSMLKSLSPDDIKDIQIVSNKTGVSEKEIRDTIKTKLVLSGVISSKEGIEKVDRMIDEVMNKKEGRKGILNKLINKITEVASIVRSKEISAIPAMSTEEEGTEKTALDYKKDKNFNAKVLYGNILQGIISKMMDDLIKN